MSDEPEASAFTSPPREFFVPAFPPDHPPVPRHNDCDNLHRLLSDHDAGQGKDVARVVTLTGPAGVGKTWLAMQYIEQHRPAYDLVVWIDGFSTFHLTHGFVQLAPALGMGHLSHEPAPAIVEHMVNHLNSQHKWLLVLDGCRGDLRELTKFLPTVRGSVLACCTASVAGFGVSEAEYACRPLSEERVSKYLQEAMPHRAEAEAAAIKDLAVLCQGMPVRMALCAALGGPCPCPTPQGGGQLAPLPQRLAHCGGRGDRAGQAQPRIEDVLRDVR